MNERKKLMIQITVAIIGVVAGLLAIHAFNCYVLMSLPLIWRIILTIVTYFPIGLVPFFIIVYNKENWSDYGFSIRKLGRQILIGLVVGICMSFVLTVIPHLAGKSEWVDNQHHYQYLWQFLYDFFYCIFAVALVEEFVFCGFFYKKLETLFDSSTGAIIGSSVLFGLFHFLSGNIVQILLTGVIGAVFCIFRVKIKNCTLLSVILAHGVYDALITVWLNVFT